MPKTLRLVALILLAPIWLPFWLLVMGVGATIGQPMTWASMVMHWKYRPKSGGRVTRDGGEAQAQPHEDGRADFGDQIGATEAQEEGFYWVTIGQTAPRIAHWSRGKWWVAGDSKPWRADAVTIVSGQVVFKPRG